MPPLVTSLPWLSNQPDPVQTYQRSQALVQQMQAQQAQERQAQAALAQRAQEAAMQAQFQQRALALKEQEAKSAVQVEADRLRQKGQALEFEQKAQEAEQRYLQAPPEAIDLGGGVTGYKYRGNLRLDKPGAFAGKVNTAIPVIDPTTGQPIGSNVVTSENTAVFRANPVGKPSAEEIKAQRQERDDQKFVRQRLVDKEKELRELQPGTLGYKLLKTEPEQLKAIRDYAAVKKELDAIGKPAEKSAPLIAGKSKQVDAKSPAINRGVRVRRKSDGKILRYQGNRADVKLDEFEIVE